MKRLLSLAAIEIFVWLGLLLCTLLISKVVFAFSLGSSAIARIATEIARVVLSGAIILTWLLAWKKLTNLYLWRTIARRKTTA